LKIVTFYAECNLPEKPQAKQAGFDWLGAIDQLARSGARFGYKTLIVTDEATDLRGRPAWLRAGNAKRDGIMLWLLDAQHAAVAKAPMTEVIVMVSPDTLIAAPLDFMVGRWDVAMLTRGRPKPIVNSVISVRPGPQTESLWGAFCDRARHLPPESKAWGADIDALVDVLGIRPMENTIRAHNGVSVRFLPINGRFVSVPLGAQASRLRVPLWDFKGARKALMPDYARLL
jgi:hypothetical protein